MYAMSECPEVLTRALSLERWFLRQPGNQSPALTGGFAPTPSDVFAFFGKGHPVKPVAHRDPPMRKHPNHESMTFSEIVHFHALFHAPLSTSSGKTC